MRHLWQRIFIYSLLLILLTQPAILLLHNYTRDQDGIRRFMSSNVSALADAMQDRGTNTAERVVSIFNQNSDRAWVVGPDGAVLAGRTNAEVNLPPTPHDSFDYWQDGEVELWQLGGEGSGFIGSAPVLLRGGEARLYVLFNPPRNNDTWNSFLIGLLTLTAISGLLTFWIARSVSMPLRRLRSEVLEIAGGTPGQASGALGQPTPKNPAGAAIGQKDNVGPRVEKRVTVNGRDEISDVALAVNHMADSLSRNVKSMRELVANVSHELRSPLARMQVTLALLEESIPSEKNGGEACGKAAQKVVLLQEELDHMEKLIGATLLSSKLDLQQLPPLTNQVAFSELCAEMTRRQTPLFAKNGLTFRADIEPGLAFKGDETLLCNLVGNLLDNAAKYTNTGGQADLRLHRQNTTARLEVENTRSHLSPLPEDQLKRIFEPFNRAGLATGNGVGLGLSLVKKIAELHGGRVWAANTAAGFCIYVEFSLN
ncbi:MAG: HAMP domain-containing histidine kinase [Deltaproteobacteria bacterium]|jgi:two-component system sensor histidine kinase CpxA|nr:HAMP domain-containing histidine kinase [Deltaproteobacteria bacterium]